MSTDRELLELAAKAVGRTIDPIDAMHEPEDWMCWNPLESDGDALRLAVRLGLQVHTSEDSYVFAGIAMTETGLGFCECRADDPSAATRRAIVRAAAAIGESMP